MTSKEKRRRFFRKLKNKYRLIIYNDTTLEQVWHLRLSRLSVMGVFIPVIVLVIALVVVLIAFTPIRELIPGYPNKETRREIVYNAMKVDSLENVVQAWDLYVESINNILQGKDAAIIEQTIPDTLLGRASRDAMFQTSDSAFRAQVEREEQFNLAVQDDKKSDFTNLVFFPPLKGEIITPFSSTDGHFGIDIATTPAATITAVLDGTILSSYWTIDDGYTIIIQHTDNLVSIYKLAARLLKKSGDRVTSGEPIGFTRIPTDKNTKTDIHFELWHNGSPINPAIHIAL